MTAPVIEETWTPEGWAESSPPCEILRGADLRVTCDKPAAIGYRHSCCGAVKLVCSDHWIWLNTKGNLTSQNYYLCLRCGQRWYDFTHLPINHWRI